ncbi:hypothetical protein BC937DRAFT_90186 [Endogone sp. FLAS-F59071]|nr:hypothetical protein BC937DRAFT_90186 [Endogone sp. FLAS-F59071]|eukprot:RUS23239.1 hypothetical protein BC937DRAFT_90186 [Endogone sp. FLAS-F59071]
MMARRSRDDGQTTEVRELDSARGATPDLEKDDLLTRIYSGVSNTLCSWGREGDERGHSAEIEAGRLFKRHIIRNYAVALNRIYIERFPVVLGVDCAGIVEGVTKATAFLVPQEDVLELTIKYAFHGSLRSCIQIPDDDLTGLGLVVDELKRDADSRENKCPGHGDRELDCKRRVSIALVVTYAKAYLFDIALYG